MSIFEDLQKALEESFSYTLHDKLIFISGYLDGDSDNEDLLDFVNYLLYTEKENMSFPKLDLSLPNFDISPELKRDLLIPRSSFDLSKPNHSESLCNSCKKVHKGAGLELNCEGCPNNADKSE